MDLVNPVLPKGGKFTCMLGEMFNDDPAVCVILIKYAFYLSVSIFTTSRETPRFITASGPIAER